MTFQIYIANTTNVLNAIPGTFVDKLERRRIRKTGQKRGRWCILLSHAITNVKYCLVRSRYSLQRERWQFFWFTLSFCLFGLLESAALSWLTALKVARNSSNYAKNVIIYQKWMEKRTELVIFFQIETVSYFFWY